LLPFLKANKSQLVFAGCFCNAIKHAHLNTTRKAQAPGITRIFPLVWIRNLAERAMMLTLSLFIIADTFLGLG
jgi:hypothetical protein